MGYGDTAGNSAPWSSDGATTYSYDIDNRLTGTSSGATLAYDPDDPALPGGGPGDDVFAREVSVGWASLSCEGGRPQMAASTPRTAARRPRLVGAGAYIFSHATFVPQGRPASAFEDWVRA